MNSLCFVHAIKPVLHQTPEREKENHDFASSFPLWDCIPYTKMAKHKPFLNKSQSVQTSHIAIIMTIIEHS